MPAPQIILDLVQRFHDSREQYRSGRYNEAQLRREFLDPFFAALGWDMTNAQNNALRYREVIQEDTLEIEGQAKAPDYSFGIFDTRKFFVEAKKPAVNIRYDIYPAFQLRRYAWSAHLPLSILTDFEELAVYDTRVKPDHKDSAAVARTMLFTYTEYAERWDEIAAIFSKEAILQGSFDRYVQDNKAKKGTAEVDDDFLKSIEEWRTLLARNIALRNPSARSESTLNYAVQMTLDRIIFLRICEDRGIEPENQLRDLTTTPGIYPRLVNLYIKADQKYNSGLFHFGAEKGQTSSEDTFTPNIAIDDKVLKEIITSLYYPASAYAFNVIPVEILGQVYEQFLGKVIRLTAGGSAKIEEKPEVRKAGGVYYTPRYIVDYIVENTVGKLLEGKTPREAAELRIVDPACGSGSFLLGAYQYLLDWHHKYYLDPANGGADSFTHGRNPVLVQRTADEYYLTTAEKKHILVNNIYGVDLDHQAVEVTKLSLLLKLLEEETGQLSLGFERVLPDLGHNIRCGNSLIGWDYFQGQLLADDEEVKRVNPFNWQEAFPEVFAKGGFDAVIGNPPYVRQESLGQDKQYYQKSYEVYAGSADLYSYFIERGIKLLAPGGVFSYIVANKWMRASYGRALRQWLKTKCIEEITDFGDLKVFTSATTYPCILRVSNSPPHYQPWVTTVKTLEFPTLAQHVQEQGSNSDQTRFLLEGWSLADVKTQNFLDKISQNSIPLEEYIDGKMYRGLLTGLNEAFIITRETKNSLIDEDPRSDELIKPFLQGKDIKRYGIKWPGDYIIFTKRGTDIKQYPAIYNHLLKYKEQLTPRPKNWTKTNWKGRKPGPYQWFEIQDQVAYYKEFENPKIIWGNLAQAPKFTMDMNGFYINAPSVIIPLEDYYLLGILNSSVCKTFMSKIAAGRQGGFFEYKPVYVSKMPIHRIKQDNVTETQMATHLVGLVKQRLSIGTNKFLTPIETDQLERKATILEAEINEIVSKLYNLEISYLLD